MTKLDELIHVIEKDHVYIQTHNYPDPDALASAKGLQNLLEKKGKEAVICYKGRIDKYNTLKMLEYFDICIVPGENLLMREEDEIILVDCQKGNTNVKDFAGQEIACIDHHKLQKTDAYRFHDIRSHIGACSSIIASYYLENDIPMDTDMATTLLYGIKMDTSNLTRETDFLDVDIFNYLYKRADQEVLRNLDNNSIKRSDLNSYAKAIENLHIQDSVGITDIGNNCSEAMIGALSDFILTLTEVHFSVVYSYRAGGLKFSVRSDTPKYDAARIIKTALQDFGDGGGHAALAAGFIPDLQEGEAIRLVPVIEERIVGIIRGASRSERYSCLYGARSFAR